MPARIDLLQAGGHDRDGGTASIQGTAMGGSIDANGKPTGDYQPGAGDRGAQLAGEIEPRRTGPAAADDRQLGCPQTVGAAAYMKKWWGIGDGGQQRGIFRLAQGHHSGTQLIENFPLSSNLDRHTGRLHLATQDLQGTDGFDRQTRLLPARRLSRPDLLHAAKMPQQRPQLAPTEAFRSLEQQAQTLPVHVTLPLYSATSRSSALQWTAYPWPPVPGQGFLTLSMILSGRLAFRTSP